MQTHDCIQAINHVLDIGCDKTLEDFRPKQEFTLMPLGSIRTWSPSQKRWMRGAPGVPEMPELTDEMLDPSNINVLLITMDQKQSQWAAGQFLADNTGLGLFVGIREDGFHRAWRDFQLAMSHSKGNWYTQLSNSIWRSTSTTGHSAKGHTWPSDASSNWSGTD